MTKLLSCLLTSLFFLTTPALADKPAKAIPEALAHKVVSRYVEVVRATYADSLQSARELNKKLNELVDHPSQASLDAARDAWRNARKFYGPTEAFRFYGGPIDAPEDGPEGLVNAWPIDESYIDYVKGQPDAGVINHPKEYPDITKELLVSLNEKNGEKNISTGFHAIEFLLWGQDQSLKGPGNRPYTDYVEGKGPNAARRGTYLKLLGALLEEHLAKVASAWDAKTPGNYGEKLEQEPLEESLRKIYTGAVNLSIDEMAGERMTVALENSDQENEQDCFSDNTLNGMVFNEEGVHNVFFGRYGKTTGPGLKDLIQAVDPALAKKTEAKLKAALKDLKAIPAPFDNVLAEKKSGKGRKAAKKAIAGLEDQAKTLAKSGLEFGLILNI
jgi:putative iron-regulated protein